MPRPSRGTIDVHTHKDGLRTFYVRMTVDGRRRARAPGHRPRGLDAWARRMVALEEQLDGGAAPAPGRRPTSAGAPATRRPDVPRCSPRAGLRTTCSSGAPSTVKDVKWRLESHLLPHIGEDRLSTFDIPRVTAVKTALLKESRRIAERHRRRRRRARRAQHAAAAAVERVDQQVPGAAEPHPRRRRRARLPARQPGRGACAACATTARAARCSSPTRSARCSTPPTASTAAPAGVTDKVLEVAELRAEGPSATSRSPSGCRSRCRPRTTARRATSRPAIRSRSFASGCGCCAPPGCASTRRAAPAAATST